LFSPVQVIGDIKTGGVTKYCNQTLERELKVMSDIRAGALGKNRNQRAVRGINVKSRIKGAGSPSLKIPSMFLNLICAESLRCES